MSSSITILLLGLSACDSLLIITSLFMFGLPGILNHQACFFTTITFTVLFSLLGSLSGGEPTVQLVRQLHLPLHCPLPLSCQCFFTPYKCLLSSELFFPPIHIAYMLFSCFAIQIMWMSNLCSDNILPKLGMSLQTCSVYLTVCVSVERFHFFIVNNFWIKDEQPIADLLPFVGL